MHISKFDLYRSEWLELVFDDRNKEYGAYDLRKHYSGNLVKAMGITFVGVSLLFIACGVLFKYQPVEIIKEVPVTLDPRIIVIPPKVEQPKPITHQTPKPALQVATTKYTIYVPKPDIQTLNPPTTEEISKSAIGTETVKGPETTGNAPVKSTGTGDGTAPKANNDPVSTIGLDIMPEPNGGSEAWLRFLQKNIRYPGQAMDDNVQGRVFLSFIIERDGHLSNITVDRGPGHGLDDEALRVLKLAPAWKPGKQNGQAVRVKYTIPINFILPDNG
jgi:periplasmic protein TonB